VVRRLLPALAGSQALGILLADRGLLGGGAALGIAAFALAAGLAAHRRPRLRASCALLLALAAGAGALARRLEAAGEGAEPGVRELTVEGTVAEVRRGPQGWRVDLDRVVDASGADGSPSRVRLYGRPTPPGPRPFEAAPPGARVRARVRLHPPMGRRNPGLPDGGLRLRRAGIGAVGGLAHPALHVSVPERDDRWPPAAWGRARADRSARLGSAGPGGAAGLGIAHLLAVSGLHLALVASLLYAGARLASSRVAWVASRWDTRGAALGLAVAGAAGYALLAGWEVPVRRALVLLCALALRFARGRPGQRLEPLAGAALLVLAAEPEALFAPGAQLSFAASAALSLAPRQQATSSGAAARLDEALRVAATALAVTAPLAALHLGTRAPFALLVNLVAVPWTGLVLLPAALLAAGAVGCEARACAWVVAGAERAGAATLAAAEVAAERVPAAVGHASPAWPWLAACALLAAAAVKVPGTAARVALAAAIGLVLWLAPAAPLPPELPRAVFLDVGQGDATLVQGRRAAVLVDAALAVPDGPDLGRRVVVPALRALGVDRLDLILLTHADLDHRGGVAAVLEAFPVGEVWLPRGAWKEAGFDPVRGAANARGVTVRERGAGDPTRRVGDLSLTPLWPPSSPGGLSRNDRSLVVRIAVAGRRLLLPGDIEASGEARLLASGADLVADVLELPHHGSRSSSGRLFLDAVGASVVVVAAPCAGRFGMPHRPVRERARAAGAPLWWTGRDGAVRVGLGAELHVIGTGPRRRCPGG
jgi:competence protein ComEC